MPGRGKPPCFPSSLWVTVGCWWGSVGADPRFPGSDEWGSQSCVLHFCTWSSGARRFPICSVHTLYGFKPPWGLARIWRLLLAKNPLSPLNSGLHKEPCEVEESPGRSRLPPHQPCLPCCPSLPLPGSLLPAGFWPEPLAAWDRPGGAGGRFCWCCATV